MRVNLRVPYDEKDQAKAHGARWDPARKTWYVVDHENLGLLARWIPQLCGGQQQELIPRRSVPVVNPALPACCCASPPWEHCEHTTNRRP